MAKIVNQLFTKPDSGALSVLPCDRCAVPFREPVDWRGLGLYDYPQIIKKPMDLSTVKNNIDKGIYQSVQECAEDIRLIWSNCKKYNQDGSDFYLLADAFSKKFEEKFAKIKTEDQAAEEVEHAPTHEEKIRFAHNIYKIDQEELGK